jgi:catechol 2,3-dioxygenase-like lactoylglutathione lyase family enzyme
VTDRPRIESINAVTLIVSDMARSVDFFTDLGFELRHGSPSSDFASFAIGEGYLNLARGTPPDGL